MRKKKKVILSYITNDSMRRSTFKKRKLGFMKKLNELSVLCGVEACAVIYSPFDSSPAVWPSNIGVQNVLEKFAKLSKSDQEKKMMTQEGFLREYISKTLDYNKKKMKDNEQMILKETMFQFLRGNGDKFNLTNMNRENLCKYIEEYLKELDHHKGDLSCRSNLEHGESSGATNVIAAATTSIVETSCPNIDVPLVEPIISSSSQRQDPVNTFSNNFVFTAAEQQGHNQYEYQEEFEYPIVAQDEIYDGSQNQNQNQNQDERNGLVSQMMDQYPNELV